MTDLDKIITDLRTKAEAANKSLPLSGTPLAEHAWSLARGEFYAAANPTTILALCDALTKAWGDVERLSSEEQVAARTYPDHVTLEVALRDRIAKKDTELATLRAKVERLRAENSRLIKSNTGESYQAGPTTKAVMAYIRANPKFTTNKILVDLQLPNKAVRNALAYCVRRGALRRIGYGRYETPLETTS